jgi:hypothetical protein
MNATHYHLRQMLQSFSIRSAASEMEWRFGSAMNRSGG